MTNLCPRSKLQAAQATVLAALRVKDAYDAKRRQKAASTLSKYVLRPISDRLCRGRSSKAKRSKSSYRSGGLNRSRISFEL